MIWEGERELAYVKIFSELEYAIKKVRYTSKKEEIIIEEYIEGSYHGVSTILKNKKVIFYCHDDEYYWENKFLVGGTSYPSSMSEGILKQVINDIERVSDELNLVDGLLHAQLINQGYTCMIGELTRRTPGDSYLSFAEKVSDYNYIGNYVAPFLGKKLRRIIANLKRIVSSLDYVFTLIKTERLKKLTLLSSRGLFRIRLYGFRQAILSAILKMKRLELYFLNLRTLMK